MMPVVFDCNVVLSGIGWSGSAPHLPETDRPPPRFPFLTDAILAEYESVIPETLAEEVPEVDPHPKMAWIRAKFRLINPAPLGKRRSRDVEDDMYLACALAASARYLITYDGDLLALEKPFGIQTIRPAELLRQIKA